MFYDMCGVRYVLHAPLEGHSASHVPTYYRVHDAKQRQRLFAFRFTSVLRTTT